MIEFKNVSFQYETNRKLIEHLSFTIEDGQSVGLIGANGAGKSTIMKLLLGLLPFEGSILVDGISVTKKNLSEVRKRVGFVLQDSDNQMFMPTVYEDMMFAPRNYGLSMADSEKKVDDALKQLGIEDLKYRYNHKLSGGEKRMAAIATILAMEPHTILMDEPSTALDPVNRRILIHTIKSIRQTKLVASHDLDLILDTCDRVILLNHGHIVSDGEAKTILKDKELLEANRMELPLCLQRVECL